MENDEQVDAATIEASPQEPRKNLVGESERAEGHIPVIMGTCGNSSRGPKPHLWIQCARRTRAR